VKENIVEFPDRNAIAEEAGAWLVKLDRDQAPSAEELDDLREWMQRSPVHREELNSLAALWDKMNVLTELAVPLEKPQTQSTSTQAEQGARTKTGFFEGFGRLGFATAAIVLVFTIVFTAWTRPDPITTTNGLYATAVGQQQETVLADGSVVLLNTNSQINVEYGALYRDVHLLQGEAHFTVAKNAGLPFRVFAGNGRVQAVGTAFSVYLKNNAVDVTVTEGSVALASLLMPEGLAIQNKPTQDGPATTAVDRLDSNITSSNVYSEDLGTLKAGQSTTIRSIVDDQISQTSTLDIIQTVDDQEMTKRLSWRQGLLTFAGDPLEQVVDEISRYTTVSIEITDPAVRAIKIGGQFPVGETDAMLDALEANFGLHVTRMGQDHVLLSAAKG
jgi:transmembrane sensor